MQRSEQEIKLSLYPLNCDHPMQGIAPGGGKYFPYDGLYGYLFQASSIYERVGS